MDGQMSLVLDGGAGRAGAGIVRRIEVRRSVRRRRTVAARLEGDTLVVFLPQRMTRGEEASWIERMRRRIEAQAERERLNGAGDLERRARDLNERHFEGALRWSSIEYVTNQRQRYGSCTPGDGTIRLSSDVAAFPGWVRDYVIVHELAHLLIPDHSEAFWELVGRYDLSERARGYLIRAAEVES